MFWFKRSKRNIPEDMKEPRINTKTKIMHLNNGDIDYITEAIIKALAHRTNPLVRLVMYKIKTDKKFFDEFINFLKRSGCYRDVLLNIVKTNFIESCRKIFSKKE